MSVRIWLLRNAEKFRIRSSLLFTVFLGFTSDPYPYVREAALDGLVGLSKTGEFESLDAIEGCYCRAVELLKDTEDCVRSAAVRAVRHRSFNYHEILIIAPCLIPDIFTVSLWIVFALSW